MNSAPLPIDIQDFLFKQINFCQLFDGFKNIPKAASLLCTDGKRGLSYIGHDNLLMVLKLNINGDIEWKFDIPLPGMIRQISANCDYSLLAVSLDQPSALIYKIEALCKNSLELLHEIRLSSFQGEIFVSDIKWNPAIPELLCSVTTDHVVGCFSISKEKQNGVSILGLEKIPGYEANCVAWSPKGKQIVIGCKNGAIVQLKPELKVARQLPGPNPSEGSIVSILWISNFQFCVCFLNINGNRVNVVIVDAPKGATNAAYTAFDDITFGTGGLEDVHYFFEHIPEWSIIIASSSHSSEIAVMGSSDNGGTWCQWQLKEDGGAQLPLIRKEEKETFPLGVSIYKNASQTLPWGPEHTLPHPLPILEILVTSGQLCTYHIINLAPSAPCICSPVTEIVNCPPIQTDVSFDLPSGATSTPRLKSTEIVSDKLNLFGISNKSNNAFIPPEQNFISELPKVFNQNQSHLDFPINRASGQFDNKSSYPSTNLETIKPFSFQTEIKTSETATKGMMQNKAHDNITKINQTPLISTFSTEIPSKMFSPQNNDKPTQLKENITETTGSRLSNVSCPETSSTTEKNSYDDSTYLRAFYKEQARFEKELKTKLEIIRWECGTEEEKKIIIEKTVLIEQFFKELDETTISLANDVAYLKALLFQSFAWLEKSKSKNSSNLNLSMTRSEVNNKLSDLQRRYYYNKSLFVQATKAHDLKWSEQQSNELSKMKLPNIEAIYQTLVKNGQIILQTKFDIEMLWKKWRSIGRQSINMPNLDKSMGNLNLSHTNTVFNDSIIESRCRIIATRIQNFTQEKQSKLRNHLIATQPKVVKVARPTTIHDRLEATLSSLASSSINDVQNSNQLNKTSTLKPDASKSLGTLNNFVSVTKCAIKELNPTPLLNGKSFKSPQADKFQFSNSTRVSAESSKQNENSFMFTSNSNLAAGKEHLNPVSKSLTNNLNIGNSVYIDPQVNTNVTIKPTFGNVTTTSQSIFSNNLSNIFTSSISTNLPSLEATLTTQSSLLTSSKAPLTFSLTTTASDTRITTSAAILQQNKSFTKQDSAFKIAGKSGIINSNIMPQALDFSSLELGSFTGNGSTKPPITVTIPNKTPPKVTTSTDITPPQKSLAFGSTNIGLSSTPIKSIVPSSTDTQLDASPLQSMFKMTANVNNLKTEGASLSSNASIITSSVITTIATSASNPTVYSSTSATSTLTGLLGATTSLNFGTPATTIDNSVISTTASSFSFTSTPSKPAVTDTSKSFLGTQTTLPPSSTLSETKPITASSTTIGNSPVSVSSAFGGLSSIVSTSSGLVFDNKTATTGSIFGGTQTLPPTPFGNISAPTLFGGLASSTSTSTSTPVSTTTFSLGSGKLTAPTLSSSTASTTGSSIFGGNGISVVSTSSTSVFGMNSTASTTATSVFGTNLTSSTTTTPSIFGGSTMTTATTSLFGTSNSTSSTPIFGANSLTTSASVFGTNTAVTTSTSIFGGTPVETQTPAPSIFGTNTSTPSAFGTSSSLFNKSNLSTGSTPLFGGNTTSPAPAFGAPAFGGSANTPGNTSVFGTNTGTANSNVFGSPPQLGTQNSVFSGTPFGTASPLSSNSVFGQSAFGAKPVFGSTSPGFGDTNKQSFGFGTPSTFGSSPGFGSAPTFGSTSPMGSSAPMQKVFGQNSTFEALAAQPGGLSFGSLAQKSPEPEKPPSFGGSSSFSSWR